MPGGGARVGDSAHMFTPGKVVVTGSKSISEVMLPGQGHGRWDRCVTNKIMI